jgi:hypothetical protein
MDKNATIEEQCYICGPCREVITRTVGAMSWQSLTRVEAGSNTSIVTLRIAEGERKKLSNLRQ